jgi:4-amino-4-deoxy-L-arabinose transferase-like glycosyltransferase
VITRVRRFGRWHLAAILVVGGLALIAGLGNATFWEPDEPRFAEATRQMFYRHDFFTPYLNGVPRFEKPILLYWLQALSFGLFGDTELSARVPSALAGIGIVLLLYLLSATVASPRAGLMAALVMATMFRFVTFARMGLTDVPAVFFIVGALYGFVRASRPALLWAWACVGLGLLTKGPVGFLPLAIWGTYAAFNRDWSLFARIRPVVGLSLALAIALPWYLVMATRYGHAFIDFALGHEIFERVVAEAGFAPTRGVFYYLKVWPGDAAPWSALFIAGAAWASWRWSTLDSATRQPLILAIAWFVAVFVLFSLSRSKVPHYVLPAYPAAALFIGVFVDRMAQTGGDTIWWRVPIGAIAIVAIAAAAATALLLDVLAPGGSAAIRWLVPAALSIGAVAAGYALWKRTPVPAVCALACTLAVVFALIGVLIVPRVIEPFKPMPLLAREAARVGHPGAPLGLLGRYGVSSLVYYSRHNVRALDDDDATVAMMSADTHALCVMPLADFQRLAPRLEGTVVIAMAEEFNVRIERLLERQKTPGRQWVLVGR